uniref:Uncharacterized protein n=1 Tax=Glossina austeni TaxID=7395 RepID=A0A1A9V9M7_GLOAU
MVVAQQIKRTKSVELMSLWRLIGALLVLSATTGDSANKIVLPQQISNGDNTINVPTGMHHFTKNSILAGSKGTVVSSNGVIVAGNTAHASSVPSSAFNICVYTDGVYKSTATDVHYIDVMVGKALQRVH